MTKRRRSVALLLATLASCSSGDDRVPGDTTPSDVIDAFDDTTPTDVIDWGSACDPVVCQRTHGNGQLCTCVSERCVCRCDYDACNGYCSMASEELGFCEADDSCRCDCPFGHCYDAEAGTPDASDGDDGGAGGCTATGGECGDGEVCDLHSCDPAAVGSCVPRPEPCAPDWSPICGCDGVTYLGDCERLRAGAPAARTGFCDGTLCAPECRIDASGVSFWMYPCTDEYLCNANCAGCTASGSCSAWRAICPDRRTDQGCTADGEIDRGTC